MAQKFLTKGYAIKLTVWFKGREASRKDLGKVVIDPILGNNSGLRRGIWNTVS